MTWVPVRDSVYDPVVRWVCGGWTDYGDARQQTNEIAGTPAEANDPEIAELVE